MPNKTEDLIFTNKVDRQYLLEQKRKRKQARNDTQLTWMLRLLFVAVLVLYFLSDISKIKQITVAGNVAIDKKAIIQNSGLSLESRYYGFSPLWIEYKLRKHPLIKQVHVRRENYQIVQIEIVEKPIVASVFMDQLSWLLSDGTVVKAEADNQEYVTQVPYLEDFEETDLLGKIARYLPKVNDLTKSLISEIALFPLDYDPEYLKIHMIDGNTVYVSIMNLENINGYPKLVNAIHAKNACIFFESVADRAYTSECLD